MTQPEPLKKKSRSWYPWIVGFVGAFGLGLGVYSNQPAKPAVNAGAQAQDKSTNARARVLQQQLAEIGQRPVATIDDYIRNTIDAAPIIDEAKSLVPLQIASINHFQLEHASSEKDAMIATYALQMFQKDGEILSLMGSEIYCARALQALPTAKRAAYYKENVLVLKKKEQQAGKEWAAIAKEASDKGVSWSDAVTNATKALE